MEGIVTVTGGRLRGVWRNDMWSFSGIPYAQAPEGPLRWRPPQSPLRWDGVREASHFGPIAPQPVAAPGFMGATDPAGAESQSEDCLTLNIWTPEVPAQPTTELGGGRPVMVWIHGGGFTSGSGSVFLYRGSQLVRHGDVVVVTINYRLGALGFLGHRDLHDPDGLIGNWGLQDQLAALRWVRDHIALFGGDAGNVTVFGESAGAMSIATLLGTPAASGLFRRAVVQSGGVHVHSVAEAERAAGRLATALGLPGCSRDSLGAVPFAELVAATDELARHRPDPGLIPLPFLPTVDGVLVPQHPLAAIERGAAADVDLLIGTNRDELTLFGLSNPALRTLDHDGVARWAANAAPDVPGGELLESYTAVRLTRSEEVDAWHLLVAVGSDGVFRWPSLQLAAAQAAQGAPAHVYLFDWESPAFGGILGSSHALELPFVFGWVHVPAVQLFAGAGAEVDELSRQMQQAWLSFARTGDPSHDGVGRWSTWDPGRRATMIFGRHTRPEDAPRDAELAVWERYRPLYAGGVNTGK